MVNVLYAREQCWMTLLSTATGKVQKLAHRSSTEAVVSMLQNLLVTFEVLPQDVHSQIRTTIFPFR